MGFGNGIEQRIGQYSALHCHCTGAQSDCGQGVNPECEPGTRVGATSEVGFCNEIDLGGKGALGTD